MKLSIHALERWCSRFPALRLYDEWSRANERRPTKKLLNMLRKQTTLVKGHKYRVSPNGVVFVLSEKERVVTVFKLATETGELCHGK